jgi:hypothetical protein
MNSAGEAERPTELLVVGAVKDNCHICASFLAGRRARSCTSLLYDPRETLSHRNRWPNHLCNSDFMQRSIEVWVSRVVGHIIPAITLWAECYPLPIGEAAARRLFTGLGQRYPRELKGLLPFRGVEEAYWGLRVGENRSVLDMFGLKGGVPPGDDAGEYLSLGSFTYSLRGRDDTSLMRLVEDGTTWWRDFSVERVHGRPRGSGMWTSVHEFESELRTAVGELQAHGQKVTQENAASLLHCDLRTLKRWLKRSGTDWRGIRAR